MPEAVIVPKLTGIEWQMQDRGLPMDETIRQLQEEGSDTDILRESHFRQLEVIYKLSKELSGVPVVKEGDWTKEVAKNYKTVISPGGDNHLLYVARYLDDQTLVGLNNDPLTSKGKLDAFKSEDIGKLRDSLMSGHFQTEDWTRLQATRNGELLPYYATGEIFIGEYKTRGMARSKVTYRGETSVVKGSGILVSTGAGLTGWHRNVVKDWKDEIVAGFEPFKRTDRRARFIFMAKDEDLGPFRMGDLVEGEELYINSLEKQGEISFESDPSTDAFSFEFNRGTRATVSIALDHPLRVAVLR